MIAALSCGGGSVGPLGSDAGDRPAPDDRSAGSDPQDLPGFDDAGLPDLAVEGARTPDADAAGDEPDAPGPCAPPAAIGCPCETNLDCRDGYCVWTDEGSRCTAACDPKDVSCLMSASDWCERPGWALQKVFSPLFGARWLCLPLHPKLCRPCRSDADCASWTSAVCLDYGAAGRFCATRCNDIVGCPDGYDCVETRGEVERVCRRADAECACSSQSIAEAAKTVCVVHNDAGACIGERRCTPAGLTACDAKTPAPETCDGLDNDCDGRTDEDFPDLDGDGVPDCGAGDADGDGVLDPADNCPGAFNPGQEDLDQDGLGDGCDPDLDGDGTPNETDCAPADPTIHRAAPEVCDGLDNDCDGLVDPEGALGCTYFFVDSDHDGFGVDPGRCLCAPDGSSSAVNNADCDDSNPAVHPGQADPCDQLDNDCDGETDEDGGAGGPEVCNGMDDNCDGLVDPEGSGGCETYYADADGDGFGNGAQSKCLCGPSKPYQATKAGDCNDGNGAIHPGAAEVCNGLDDNCDGATDPPGTCPVTPTRKVCLDAGHGGSDPGAVGYVVEKDVNLDIVLRFRDLLAKDTANGSGGGSWQVFLTRDSDVYVSLEARVAYANNNQVDRFLSTHNNSCGYCGGHGTETYWYTAGSAQSQDLATKIQNQIYVHLGTTNRGVKQANFYVLKYTNMPADLVECAFVDHEGDAAKLADPAMRQEAARGQMHGLQQHFGFAEFDP